MIDLRDLPPLNAGLNALSFMWLVLGLRFILAGRRDAHRLCMLAAAVTSTLFLSSYLYYHAHEGTTRFRTQGWVRTAYLTILLSHTIFAAALVPLVPLTLSRALRGRFERHRRIARWTWPVWAYVSVTGVVIYFMLYHLDPALAPRAQ